MTWNHDFDVLGNYGSLIFGVSNYEKSFDTNCAEFWIFSKVCIRGWFVRMEVRIWSWSPWNNQEKIFVSFFHIMHVSTSSLLFWRSKGNIWELQNWPLIIVQIINHFSAFVLAQLSGSDRNQKTRFRGCNRSTSRLNYGVVFRSHNYGK